MMTTDEKLMAKYVA